MNVYKYLRKQFGYTQQQLAEILNLNQTTVGKWENDKAIPDYTTLKNLSKLYNVTIDYLLGNSSTLGIATKEAWLSTLSDLDKSILKAIMRLTELQKYKVQAYVAGLLDN